MSLKSLRVRVRGRAVGIAAVGAVAAPLMLATGAGAHESPDGDALERGAAHLTARAATPLKADGFEVLGHAKLGGGGANADVWAHRGFAYVGIWSGGTCPATGVKVAEIRNVRKPHMVSRLQNPAGTSAEDVVVRRVNNKSFRGSLAVVGIQACDLGSKVFRGLQFFDVTKPSRPRLLSTWASSAGGIGCHEIDLVVRRKGRVLAGCADILAESINGRREVTVVDATNPRRPYTTGRWGIKGDKGIDPGANPENVGCVPASFAHSVRFAHGGRTLYASYWDHGLVRLAVGSKARLRYVTRIDIAPPDEDGDVHSMTPARRGRLALINPEDFSPVSGCEKSNGWGEVHVYTNRPGKNSHLSTFSTPNSRSKRTDGFYSVHNTEVGRGSQAFSSWYSDGIVWWSFANPRAPRMLGQFVPPATADPQGNFPAVPLVWGVRVEKKRNVVLASDINSGLWLVRPKG